MRRLAGGPSIERKLRIMPVSLRIRQTSTFCFDSGTSRRSCFARCALRIRVSRSAIGSVLLMMRLLPTGLDHAREVPAQRQVAKADSAERELAHEGARPTAHLAAIA